MPVRGEPEPHPCRSPPRLRHLARRPGERSGGAHRVGGDLRDEQFYRVGEGFQPPLAEDPLDVQPGEAHRRGQGPQLTVAAQRPFVRAGQFGVGLERGPGGTSGHPPGAGRGWPAERVDPWDGHCCANPSDPLKARSLGSSRPHRLSRNWCVTMPVKAHEMLLIRARRLTDGSPRRTLRSGRRHEPSPLLPPAQRAEGREEVRGRGVRAARAAAHPGRRAAGAGVGPPAAGAAGHAAAERRARGQPGHPGRDAVGRPPAGRGPGRAAQCCPAAARDPGPDRWRPGRDPAPRISDYGGRRRLRRPRVRCAGHPRPCRRRGRRLGPGRQPAARRAGAVAGRAPR